MLQGQTKELTQAAIVSLFKAIEQSEGVGARVKRTIGTQRLRNLDPFLMLDRFTVRLPSGFSDHPHRGFETVSYMQQGRFNHEDFKGHKGSIGPGDIQWMTAGRGIVHAEVPASHDEDSVGFQLWINLPKARKMDPPHYQEFTRELIPTLELPSTKVKVISGDLHGAHGAVKPTIPIDYFDVQLDGQAALALDIAAGFNTFAYIYGGLGTVNGQSVQPDTAVVFANAKTDARVFFKAEQGLKFIWLSGKPINEPIVQHGPFVMNTMQEIQEAMKDYQLNRNGFEGASTWESKIQHMMEE